MPPSVWSVGGGASTPPPFSGQKTRPGQEAMCPLAAGKTPQKGKVVGCVWSSLTWRSAHAARLLRDWGSGTGQVPPGRGCLWPARCRRGFITRVQVILERTFIGDSETKEGFRVEEATGEPGCHCALVPLGSYREGISPGGAAVRSLGHQRKGALETGPGGEPGTSSHCPPLSWLQVSRGPLEAQKK